jgi:ABC-type transporter Mla MlaB component
MLRITVQDKPRVLTFQLEGSLEGAWLRELEECWQNALTGQGRSVLRVDLTGLTSINAAGQACLAALHRQGAEFLAADCLTKAVVAEITRGQKSEVGGQARSRKSTVRNQKSEADNLNHL